jgi:Ring finger domain
MSLDTLIEEAKASLRSKLTFYFACDRPSISLIYPWEIIPDPSYYNQNSMTNSQLLEILIQPYRPNQYGALVFILFCFLMTLYRRGQRRRVFERRPIEAGFRDNRSVMCRLFGWFGDLLLSIARCIISPFSTVTYLWQKKKIIKQQNKLYKEILNSTTYSPGQADFDQETCTICLEVFQASQSLLFLGCKHYFHPICIGNWLKSKDLAEMTCPLCQTHITSCIDEASQQSIRQDLFVDYLSTLKNTTVKPNIENSDKQAMSELSTLEEPGSIITTASDTSSLPSEADRLKSEQEQLPDANKSD